MGNIDYHARKTPMRNIVLFAGMSAIALFLTAACAPHTEIVKMYEDRSGAPTAYKRLLVVDVSSDPGRQQLEDEIVRRLLRERVVGVASHTKVKSANGVLLQDDIDEFGDEIEADGILITHIVSVDTTTIVDEGRDELISTCRRGDPLDYFLYDHEILSEPDSVRLAHTVVVVTNLYDAATHKRVWTIQSTCFDKSSMSEVLFDEAEAIVRQLRIDRLI